MSGKPTTHRLATTFLADNSDVNKAFSVKLAFQIAVAQALTVFFVYIGSQIFHMFGDVVEPMFWALMCSVILKGPKDMCLNFFASNLGKQSGFFSRLTFLTTRFAMVFGPLFLAALVHNFVIGDFPWLWILLFLAVIVYSALVYLAYMKAEDYDSFITVTLLLLIFIGAIVFVVFFAFKAIMETSELVLDLKNLVETKLNDPTFRELLDSFNVTSETIEEKTYMVREHVEAWVEEQGYNVTQIKELVEDYEDSQVFDKVRSALTNLEFADIWELVVSLDYSSIYDQAVNLSGYATELLSRASEVILSLAGYILSGVDQVFTFIFFIGALFFFLGENSLLDSVFKLLPIPESNQEDVSNSLKHSVNQIFVCTFLLAISHGLVTFAYFFILRLPFAYSASALSGLATIVPFIPEWIAYVPSFAVLYFKGSPNLIFIAGGLYILRWLSGSIDDMIFSRIPGANPFLTGLAIALGASTFGLQGLLIGPILITVAKTLFTIFTAYLHVDATSAGAAEHRRRKSSISMTVEEKDN